jgi:hypothetical protein
VVLKLATEAKRDGRSPQAAVVYDEIYRRQLSESTYANAPDSQAGKAVFDVDKNLLAQADQRFKERGEQLQSRSSSHQSAWGHGASKSSWGQNSAKSSWGGNNSWGQKRQSSDWQGDQPHKRHKGTGTQPSKYDCVAHDSYT